MKVALSKKRNASFSILKPTKQKTKIPDIFGFDIETYSRKNIFYCGSIWHQNDNFKETFFNARQCAEQFTRKRYKDSIISCSNLSFDFFGTMFNEDDIIGKFTILMRGSSLLFAKTYIYKGEFHKKRPHKKAGALTFIDTFNYASLSVDKLGKLIGIGKLERPEFLGQKPKDDIEKEQLIRYNMRDCEVSAKSLKFLYDSFVSFGASVKLTIASTAMSLFKNKYLKDHYFRHDRDILLEQFKGYYGGRTEALSRGKIEGYNYYDFNSLYPSVMRDFEYPDPNTLRTTRSGDMTYIRKYEGMSEVKITSPPDMNIPLLPTRLNGKLIFPKGTFIGWYPHIELREAEKLGYIIERVYKTYWYKKTCRPFIEFVEDLYNARKEYKKKNSPMEYVAKILMNSLYGKFGQKFIDKDNFVHESTVTMEFLESHSKFDRVGNYFRVVKDVEPPVFCIPIWSAYVTSYARIKLHRAMIESEPVYVDTDSLITKKDIDVSDELGDLKKEYVIDSGIILKPKMYYIKYIKKDTLIDHVRAKGIGTRLCGRDFLQLITTGKISFDRFVKFRESLRRGLAINEIQEITKNIDIEDNKRIWGGLFDASIYQKSEPIKVSIHDEKTFS